MPELSTKKVLLYYNEEKKPFIQVMVFEDGEIKSQTLEIDDGQIEAGIPSNIELICDSIKDLIPEGTKEMGCLINSEYVVKATNAYPTISIFKMMALYDSDIKKSFPKYKDKYFAITQKTKTKLENIYYTYLIPNNVRTFFLKLGKALGITIKGINLFSMFLLANAKKEIDGNFIYSYYNNDLINTVISYNGILTSYFTSTKEELDNNVFCYGAKHFYELEKEKIEVVTTNSSEFESKSIEFEVKELKLDFGLFKDLKK